MLWSIPKLMSDKVERTRTISIESIEDRMVAKSVVSSRTYSIATLLHIHHVIVEALFLEFAHVRMYSVGGGVAA